ncbi:Serine/threonine-protein kinase 32A [Toxocara canis]|uniref:Serine/threonine-protein kinase 32A n=1 Tax=Toxocara canis TaxID=6265 RepID=A0A0B2W5S3_TOXCA|nr:Serine/threonine-protein kinase 32A [Toxocara canis]
MGGRCSRRVPSPTHPQLSDFSILRFIGRGTFGRVCIVQYKATKKHYALKYMDKRRCVQRMAAGNVLRELDLLAHVSHPFIVNLWFSFQDMHYMYMVSDLLLGGDLRYHLNQQGRFSEDRAKLYICEIALALDYLHGEMIVHRDVKPDNILLDDQGHAHLTDFNLAIRLPPNALATSFSGTRPYMAPEIMLAALGQIAGYDHRVDWFSLGVCFYEMLRGRRPYEYTAHFSSQQVLCLMSESCIALPSHWSSDLISFISMILSFEVACRIASLRAFSRHCYMERIDMDVVLAKKTAPVFIPRSDTLNCDPTCELDEKVVGSSIIRRQRRHSATSGDEELERAIDELTRSFTAYNRHVQNLPQKQTSRLDEEKSSLTKANAGNFSRNATV